MTDYIKFKFDGRSMDNFDDRRIAQMYEEESFDTKLIASNNKVVCAHRVVLGLFSEYFEDTFAQVEVNVAQS